MKLLLVLSLFMLSTTARATTVCPGVENGAKMIFINGNAAPLTAAVSAIAAIRDFDLEPYFLTGEERNHEQKKSIKITLVFNDSPAVLRAAAENGASGLDISLVRAYSYFILGNDLGLSFREISYLDSKLVEAFSFHHPLSSPIAQKIAAEMKKALEQEKKRTIVVAHSQGALFAHAAYMQLFSPEFLGQARQKNAGLFFMAPIISEAITSPLSDSDTYFMSYLSRNNDLILNGLRQLYFPTIPPGNIEAPAVLKELSHGVVAAYLGGIGNIIEEHLQVLGAKVRDASCLKSVGK